MEEIIKKIEAEIDKLWKEDEGRGSNTVPVIVLGLQKAKEIILSEQPKEPCEYCYAWGLDKTINFCPNCGKPTGSKPEPKPKQTIGDKIRESNESLAEAMDSIRNCGHCMRYGNNCFPKFDTLAYLNQPYQPKAGD